MRNTQYTIRNTQYQDGFTIAELLLALAITGLLLAAVAVVLGLMSWAVKGERGKMDGVERLVDDTEHMIKWRKL